MNKIKVVSNWKQWFERPGAFDKRALYDPQLHSPKLHRAYNTHRHALILVIKLIDILLQKGTV